MEKLTGPWNEYQPSAPAADSGPWDEFKTQTEQPKSYGLKDFGGDLASVVTKGVMAVPQAAVGLADIATGGRAGKALEDIGVRFNDANQIADNWKSDALKAQQKDFQQAEGLAGKTAAALRSPGLLLSTVGESVPSMFAGGALAKGVGLAAPALAGRAGLAAAGEGAIMAGSQAENIRQQTDDGLLTAKQSALAVGTGLAGGAIGALGAKAAKSLGIGDVDTMIANGATQGAAREGLGLVNRVGRGALSEGVLEELPQSLTETALGNIALDRNVTQGMDEAAVLGTLSGGLMGGAAGALSRPAVKPSQAMGIDPAAGPLSRAAATAVDSGATPAAPIAEPVATFDQITPIAQAPTQNTAAPTENATVQPVPEQNATAPQTDPLATVPFTPPPEPLPMEARSLDELRQSLRNAQDPAIRKTVAAEIRRRRESMPDPLQQTIDQQTGEIALEPTPAKPIETSPQRSEAPAAEPAAAPVTLGQSLTDTGTNMLGRGADPLQSLIQEENNVRRAADVLRNGSDGSSGAGPNLADAGMANDVGVPDGTAGTATPVIPEQVQSSVGEQPASGQAALKDRKYNLVAINEKSGAKTMMNSSPMSHQEAVTMKNKTSVNPARRVQLEEISASNDRPERWRQNALQAGKVARTLGLDPKGKRLAQIVAEIDAKDGAENETQVATPNANENKGLEAISAPQVATPKDVKNAPQLSGNPGQVAQAQAVEARAPKGGNAAAAEGVPAAGQDAGVRSDGVDDLGPDTFAGSIKLEMEARAAADERKARARKPSAPAEARPEAVDSEVYRATSDGAGKFTLESDESTIAGNGDATPRKFASETDALAWAKKNGFKTAAPGAGDVQADGVEAEIQKAQASGVKLTEADKKNIREKQAKADELLKQYRRKAGMGQDPMNKGNSFPMGVGFTKMTKRSAQRIDASVRTAGESVELFKKYEIAQKGVNYLLTGKGSEADLARRAENKAASQHSIVRRLMEWKNGDKFGPFTIERVNKDRDGYPASYTISGEGVIKGVMDRVDVAKDFFDGSKEKLHSTVDAYRADATQSQSDLSKNQPKADTSAKPVQETAKTEQVAKAPAEPVNPTPQPKAEKPAEDDAFMGVKKDSGRDAEYLAAVERGDMEAAQKMVDQAARDAGYISGNDYRMAHQAPNSQDDISIAAIRESGLVPDDYWTTPRFYQNSPEEYESFNKVTASLKRLDLKGKNYPVSMTVYRAVPKDVKDAKSRNGDWVTPSLEYAKSEGAGIPGGFRVISQQALLRDLYWDGNSIAELGYDDGQGYAYKNTKNNRKLMDVVTRDDDGNIIPLSKRFNARSDDTRFFGDKSKRTQGTPADRAVMAMASDGKSADDILRFIASASKSPYRRQLAKKLLATGANPAVSLGGEMGGGAGFRFLAKYSRQDHEVTLSEAAADRAEQIFLHETVHAATLLALDKKGLIATQMKRLYEHAKQQSKGEYGFKNVGEFVAEAFTNPEFQKALKGMKADNRTLWERLVNIVRRIMGLPDTQQDALSRALELGAEVMRENMPLRAAKSFRAEDAPAFAGESLGRKESEANRRAFLAGSKVRQVVYHATRADFNAFDTDKSDLGAHFGNEAQANRIAGGMRLSNAEGTQVMPVWLSIKNPLRLKDVGTFHADGIADQLERKGLLPKGEGKRIIKEIDADWKLRKKYDPMLRQIIQDAGYDGVVYSNTQEGAGDSYIAFRPEQIKSATGNNGNFDPNDADIANFGVADAVEQISPQAAVKPVVQFLNDTFKVRGKLHWWHKTVGTPFNLAERVPEFKRVFNAVQDFITSVSFYGAEAAAMAPKIIPKLESWKDLGKSPISAADNKAIASPIFEGTLSWRRDSTGKPVLADSVEEAGIVWTDDELRSKFLLTDEQVGLYREFRAATDKSLTGLALSDMLQFAGDDAKPIRDVVMGMSLKEGSETLSKYLKSLATGEEKTRKGILLDTANTVMDRADKAQSLIDRGYAPLQRFGRHTIYAKNAKGEQLFFGMYEDRWAAGRAARQMREQYPDATVEVGMMSEQSYKMFQGISPETLELFGTMLGMDADADGESNKAFQMYLKLAKSNRSALKRLIERKGISGYSEDASRVLASFIYSNARQTSTNLHVGDIMNSVNDIPRDMGDAKDAAMKLARYTMDPQEEAQALRGLLFAQYLGGSIASAAINALQPAQVTFPYLSQFVGAKRSAVLMGGAVKDALKKSTGDAKLDAELKKAEEEGIVSPQEIFQLMAQAQGKATLKAGDGTTAGDAAATASNTLARLSLGWGKVFSIPEQFNRRTTFIAAYRTALETGETNPYDFAKQAVKETQLVYNKGNRPEWARGTVGALAFTFKTYSISYVELLQRMSANGPEGRRAAMLMIATLMLMAGAGGLPGIEDAENVVDGIAQRVFGLNFQSRQKRQEWLAEVFGEGGARFIENGLSGLPWSPTDVSGRLGLGNLIPGTGVFVKKQDYSRDIAEIAGPAADMTKRFLQGAGLLLQGEVLKAGEIVAPAAVRNMIQGARMGATDQYADTKGRKVIDTTPAEALTKFIGFQPADVARVQESTGTIQQMIALNKIRESEIADKWAKGLASKDKEQIQEARDELLKWNRANPDSPIRINMSQIFKRVKALNEDKATRIARTAPKEIRQDVRRELESKQ